MQKKHSPGTSEYCQQCDRSFTSLSELLPMREKVYRPSCDTSRRQSAAEERKRQQSGVCRCSCQHTWSANLRLSAGASQFKSSSESGLIMSFDCKAAIGSALVIVSVDLFYTSRPVWKNTNLTNHLFTLDLWNLFHLLLSTQTERKTL